MLGHNLYLLLSFTDDTQLINTIRQQSRIYLPRPVKLL
jgi:hypothetical protein